MSALSLFALLVAPLALKPKKPDVEPAELILNLRRELADLRRERDQALSDLAFERRANERASRVALEVLSGGFQVPAPQPPAGFGQAPEYAALQQAAAAMQSQAMAQHQAMQAQNFYNQGALSGLGQAMGLLGAQNLIDTELWCNCVPSRAQVWAANG